MVHEQLSDMRAFRLRIESSLAGTFSVLEVMVFESMLGSRCLFDSRRFANRMMIQYVSSATRVVCWSWIESSRLACGMEQPGRNNSVERELDLRQFDFQFVLTSTAMGGSL